MRTHLFSLALALLTTAAIAEDKEAIIKAEGKPALTLSVPNDVQIKEEGDKTTIMARHFQIYVWALPKAKTVAEVVPHAAELIKSEFVKYEVKSTETLKLAGHEAKHLKGTGEEADDNDPGTAEVVIFTEGKHIYAACVHGERDEAAKQRPELLKALESLKTR